MANKILINTVRIRGRVVHAGSLLDTVAEDVAEVAAAGGQLLDPGDALIDAAAERARRMRRDGEISGQSADALMAAALASSARAKALQALALAQEALEAAEGGGGPPVPAGAVVGPVAQGQSLDGDVIFEAGPEERQIAAVWFANEDAAPLVANAEDFVELTATVYDAGGADGATQQILTTPEDGDPAGTGDWPIYGRVTVPSSLVVPAYGRIVLSGQPVGAGAAIPRSRAGADLA